MQYKTIVLQLLQQRPKIHDQLRKERKLLLTMERYAKELKTSHQAWTELLYDLRPDSDRRQLSSEALEIALKELEERLPSESPPEQTGPLSLDAALAFVRSHTPPA